MRITFAPIFTFLFASCADLHRECMSATQKLYNTSGIISLERGAPVLGMFYPLKIGELRDLHVSSTDGRLGESILIFYVSDKKPPVKPFFSIGVGVRKSTGIDHMAFRASFLEVATSNPHSIPEAMIDFKKYYVTEIRYIEE